MLFCKYVAVFTLDGFIQLSEGNVPALQSPSVLAFPFPIKVCMGKRLWCVRKTSTIASPFETGVDN